MRSLHTKDENEKKAGYHIREAMRTVTNKRSAGSGKRK